MIWRAHGGCRIDYGFMNDKNDLVERDIVLYLELERFIRGRLQCVGGGFRHPEEGRLAGITAGRHS